MFYAMNCVQNSQETMRFSSKDLKENILQNAWEIQKIQWIQRCNVKLNLKMWKSYIMQLAYKGE